MRDLNLPLDRLKSLVLAADICSGNTDYINDHIWEIAISGGDPGGLSLGTTFGLRARSFRIIPRYIENVNRVSNPAEFDGPPIIHQVFPNLTLLTFSPFPGIDVNWEVWVPDSHTVASRYTIQNNGVTTRNISFDLIGLLSPNPDGHRMVGEQFQGSAVLAGQTAGLFPLIFLTGGAQIDQGPLPALTFRMTLLPGTHYRTTMIQAALESEQASFEHARKMAAKSWEAEKAHIELQNTAQVDIQTGNPEWDAILALGQQTALKLLVGPGSELPFPSFVLSREPDQGYSPRGDGSDYNHLWNGQSPLQTLYLSELLLPACHRYIRGLIENFLAAQNPDTGGIDWKPGMAGQRSLLLATPLLASLVWMAYEYDGDRAFLEQCYEPLLNFLLDWFDLRHDQDGDGIPECDHPAQLGFDDHPLYSNASATAVGADISAAESPALSAFLYQECRSLIRIAEEIERLESIPALASHAENVRAAVEASWDSSQRTYHAWDRDTHHSPKGVQLGQHEGNGSLPIRSQFATPSRIVVRVHSTTGMPVRPQITLYGKNQAGNSIERILLPERWQWSLDWGSVTTNDLYSELDSLKIQGLEPNDELFVSNMGYLSADLSLTFPLFAHIPSPSRGQELIEKTILDPGQYWQPFGLPACPDRMSEQINGPSSQVLLIWNTLVGEALTSYGYRARAAELFSHIMSGIVENFHKHGSFSARYSAVEGTGSGVANMLEGLPPLGLFFNALGVRILSPWKVHLEGQNPFPWPVRLAYRGLTVDRRNDKTIVTFPDGQAATIEDPAPCIVSAQ
jgi:hypothetical protein